MPPSDPIHDMNGTHGTNGTNGSMAPIHNMPSDMPPAPQCADSCPKDTHPTCDEFHDMLKEGGCAATCTEAEKTVFEPFFCPGPIHDMPSDMPGGGSMPPSVPIH